MHTGEFKQEECKTGECIQENSSRKNAKRENAKRENAKRENAKRENAKRENAKRENAKLENAKRENAKRENANGENLSGENAMSIEKLSEVWPEWRVTGQIGEGSFGKVYKIVREEYGVTSYAALKVISIPQSDAEIKSLRVEGMDEQSTRSYFESIVKDFINEIKLMVSMKGTSNIVSVEDFKVIERTDIVGWDVLIRMELLTSFVDYLTDKTLSETEVIKLGQDVCSALELCSRRNIIHRDIKPENIFISDFGDYKIGDFGIARELEKTSGAMSSKGTYNYVAPEVITSKQYDSTVDIYSLGLVLYMLLNNNRLPFLDPNAQQILYQDRKNAIDRRISGVPLPAPVGASPQMSHAILQACSFNPGIRFKTANEFKNALEAVKTGVNLAPRSEEIDLYKTVVGRIAPGSDNAGIDSIPAERRTPEMSGAGIGVTAAERRAPGSGGVSFDSATAERRAPGSGGVSFDPATAERRALESGGVNFDKAAIEPRAPGSGGVSFDPATTERRAPGSGGVSFDNAAIEPRAPGSGGVSFDPATTERRSPVISEAGIYTTKYGGRAQNEMQGAADESSYQIGSFGNQKRSVTPRAILIFLIALVCVIGISAGSVALYAMINNGSGDPDRGEQSSLSQTSSSDASLLPTNSEDSIGALNIETSSGLRSIETMSDTQNLDTMSGAQNMETTSVPQNLNVPYSSMQTSASTAPPTTDSVIVGDVIEFGGYEWRVLEVENNRALILSEIIIVQMTYNNDLSDITWEECSLRQWMNGEFYNSFSEDDRAWIAQTKITNDDNQWFGARGGGATTDNIFLLSIEEVVKYFGDSGQLSSKKEYENSFSDQFDSARVAYNIGGGNSWWWLRSPGVSGSFAAFVDYDGMFGVGGLSVNDDYGGVRPALWLNLLS